MFQARKILAEYEIPWRPVDRGYAGRTLYLDLSNLGMRIRPVSEEMKERFTGGRGFALWLLWNAVTEKTQWDDPQNELVFSSGPLCGTTALPGAGKMSVVSLSPLTRSVIDSTGGGYFAPYLKFAGFDALEVQGKAEQDTILFIDGDTGYVTFETIDFEELDTHRLMSRLADIYADDERGRFAISTITSGRAGDHVRYATLNVSWYDVHRKEMRFQRVTGDGFGRVFRDKRLQAIVVKFSSLRGNSNNPADMELIRRAGIRMRKEMRYLSDARKQMNEMHALTQAVPDECWAACSLSCSQGVEQFIPKTGPYAGETVHVDGLDPETFAVLDAKIGIIDVQHVLELIFYAGTYGIDPLGLADAVAFVIACYKEGILDQGRTGGLELTRGNVPAVLELLHRMARGEGFGRIVGLGIRHMQEILVSEYGADAGFLDDIGMNVRTENHTGESLPRRGGYGTGLDEAWLTRLDQTGSQFPTFEDIAGALHASSLWRTWFSLHGLCSLPWRGILPGDIPESAVQTETSEHVADFARLLEGMWGRRVTPDEILAQSERVEAFQRVFSLRMKDGTRQNDSLPCCIPGPITTDEYESRAAYYDQIIHERVGVNPNGKTTPEKLVLLQKHWLEQYETLMNIVYKRRGWDVNGVPRPETLINWGIDLPDVLDVVNQAIPKSEEICS